MKSRSYTPRELQESIAESNWIVRRDSRKKSASASNLCRTRLDIVQYLLCYGWTSLLVIPFVGALVVIVGLAKHWDWRLTVGVFIGCVLIGSFSLISKSMSRLALGDVNPAFVLDRSHIAAFIDLKASSREPRYAVKVVAAPLSKMAGGPYRPGDRVPVTCLYFAPTTRPAPGGTFPRSPSPAGRETWLHWRESKTVFQRNSGRKRKHSSLKLNRPSRCCTGSGNDRVRH